MNAKKDQKIERIFKKENICAVTDVGKETLFLFMDVFGQALVGHKKYNQHMKSKFLFSKVCTVSDEAFGKFTLERCWESWLSEMKRSEDPQVITVKAKHTKKKSNKKFGGWNKEGLEHYSKIAEFVGIERTVKERIKQEEEYRKSYFEKLHSNVESDSEESYKIDNKYVAYNDLGTDDTIYENKDNDETNIIGNTNSDEESEREYDDNGCLFSESDNIEYAQITEYGKGGEGKICVISDLLISLLICEIDSDTLHFKIKHRL